jgi:predicted membrane protein
MGDVHDTYVMRHDRQRQPTVQVVVGLMIAILGVLFTLDNLNVLNAGDFLQFWPTVFIVIGLAQLASSSNNSHVWSGSIWIGIGVLLIVSRLGGLRVNVWSLWPLLLVLLGARIFWRSFSWNPRNPPATPADTEATATVTAILGGFERRIRSASFRRVELTAFMGGGKLDLRDAVMAPEGAVVDVFSIMGGFEILVPETWAVDIEVTPFMGGCEDKTIPHPATTAPRLAVRGFVMMGGVNIKNR